MSEELIYAGVAFFLAIGVFFVTRYVLIAQLSNVRREETANEYLVDESFKLTAQKDTFLYTNVTRSPKPRRRDNDND